MERNLRALLVNRFSEFFRSADIHELAGRGQTILKSLVGNRADIGRNAPSKLKRHVGRTKQAHQSVEA